MQRQAAEMWKSAVEQGYGIEKHLRNTRVHKKNLFNSIIYILGHEDSPLLKRISLLLSWPCRLRSHVTNSGTDVLGETGLYIHKWLQINTSESRSRG